VRSRVAVADDIVRDYIEETGLRVIDGVEASRVPQDGAVIRMVYVRVPASLIDAQIEHEAELARNGGKLVAMCDEILAGRAPAEAHQERLTDDDLWNLAANARLELRDLPLTMMRFERAIAELQQYRALERAHAESHPERLDTEHLAEVRAHGRPCREEIDAMLDEILQHRALAHPKRLNDDQIDSISAALARDTRSMVGVDMTRKEGRSAIAEIRARRAADLTPEEVRRLATVLAFVKRSHPRWEEDIALLEKILAAHGVRP